MKRQYDRSSDVDSHLVGSPPPRKKPRAKDPWDDVSDVMNCGIMHIYKPLMRQMASTLGPHLQFHGQTLYQIWMGVFLILLEKLAYWPHINHMDSIPDDLVYMILSWTIDTAWYVLS